MTVAGVQRHQHIRPEVGDSLGDLEAAKAVDSQPVLVKTGKGEKTQGKTLPVGTLIFDDLAAIAAELIHN